MLCSKTASDRFARSVGLIFPTHCKLVRKFPNRKHRERESPWARRLSPRPAPACLQTRRKPLTHASDADEFSDQRDQKSKRHKDSPDREEPPYKIASVQSTSHPRPRRSERIRMRLMSA